MNAITTLTQDEVWVINKYRAGKSSGYATVTIEVHDGVAEFITVTEKFKRTGAIREAMAHTRE